MPGRLDEMAFGWIADEQRQDAHHHPGDDANAIMVSETPFSTAPDAVVVWNTSRSHAVSGASTTGASPKARHHDAGDETGALGREPLE
jgi:hypothetical protein